MVSLLDVPSDVHFIIWTLLSLSDLATLQRVCRGIARRINDDKSLWVVILQAYVLRKGTPLPSNLPPLHRVAALDVKSWVKHAFLLQKNYRSAAVKSFRTCTYEGITWTKIIRGRWCLVASANLSNAKLAVWDLSQTNLEGPCTVMPLEGPITDGTVEDSGDYVHAAVTVATSAPFILILDLVKIDDRVCIKQLKKLTGASHVRLLRDEYVGYAVKDGVDEYPCIVNWETERIVPLRFPIQDKSTVKPESITASCPLIERHVKPESCCAMGIWRDYLIVVLLTRMHIFRISLLHSHREEVHMNLEEVSWITCLALPYFTVEALLSDINGTLEEESLELGIPCLQINLREGEFVYPIVLSCSVVGDSGVTSFALHDTYGTACPIRGGLDAARFIIGVHQRTVLWVGYPSRTRYRSYAALYLSGLTLDSQFTRMLEHEQDAYAEAHEPQIVPTNGTPLLQTLSSCDFDDGRGIAVLCSITGELCVLDFAGPGTLTSGSIQDGIPCATQLSMHSEEETCVQLDLPAYYYLQDRCMDLKNTPEIAALATRLWKEPFPIRRHIAGWSDDWSNFKGVWHWLPSWPRWGPHDLLHDLGNIPSLRARTRLYILGDMIPVLYNEQNQGRVLFRSGEQMYLTKYEGDTDDDWDFDEFQSRDILGMLPITYSEFLVRDASHLLSMINSRDVQTKLVHWYGADALMVAQYQLSLTTFWIRSYFRKKYGSPPDFHVMESWSKEEWGEHGNRAKDANGKLFFVDYSKADRLSWLQE